MHRLLLVLGFCCLGIGLQAQDIHFVQWQQSPLLESPAQTGLFTGLYRVNIHHRSQWASVPVPYRTIAMGADMRLFSDKLRHSIWGVGLQLWRDEAGDAKLHRTGVQLSSAFHKRLFKNHLLSAGANVSWIQRGFELSALTFDDQFRGDIFNGKITSADLANVVGQSYNYLDFSVGVQWRWSISSKRYWDVGGSIWHLHEPNQSFLGGQIYLPARAHIYLRGAQPLSSRSSLAPYVWYQKQGPYTEWAVGARWHYTLSAYAGREFDLIAGAGYRIKDACITTVGFTYQTWRALVSYEWNLSPFKVATQRRGGIELSLQYIWREVPTLKHTPACPIF